MITCTDPTWWSHSRCYSDAEGNESSTDHQALYFYSLYVSVDSQTNNMKTELQTVISILLKLPVLLDMVLIQWHRRPVTSEIHADAEIQRC